MQLYGYLSHSLRILHKCLAYDGDLEIPFPKPVETSKKDEPDSRKEVIDSKKEGEHEDHAETKSEDTDSKSSLGTASSKNAYDEVIPMRSVIVKSQVGRNSFFISRFINIISCISSSKCESNRGHFIENFVVLLLKLTITKS